jgi:hypothetical protein
MRTTFLNPLDYPFSKMKLNIDELRQYIRDQRRAILDWDEDIMLLHYALNDLRDAKIKLEKMEQRANRPQTDDITPEMIASAKEYPIENLVEFHKGVALAFCHPDKSPSLTWRKKSNRAVCYPCDKSFDSIQILVERDKISFPAAVRQLCK